MTLATSRRTFLAGSGAFTIAIALPGLEAKATMRDSRLPMKADHLATYISIDKDSRATGWIGKIDMGQGTDVGWAQMIAEELDLPMDHVTIVQGDTHVTINMGGASGSTGIWKGGVAMRAAAAEARRVLVDMAADKLGLPASDLRTENGRVIAKADPNKSVSYGELIGGRHFGETLEWNKVIGSDLSIKGRAQPKSPKDYRIVGKTGIQRRDVEGKILGTTEYLVDKKIEGMVHGRVIRPPVAGAMPIAVDENSIKDIPGVQIVREKEFIGLVAPREWDAVKAARQLKITWSDVRPPFPTHDTLHAHIRKAPVIKRDVDRERGDTAAAFAKATRVIEAEYEWPFQSHAPMGPASGLVDVKPDGVRMWTGSQKPHYARDGVAALLGLDPEKVICYSMIGPGSYGRNDSGDVVMDAAVLSRAVGKPVRVQSMRHEGHGWDPKGPASVHLSRVALDADNRIIGWQFESKVFSKRDFLNNEGDPSHTLAGQLLGLPLKPVLIFGPPEENYQFESFQKISNIIPPLLDRASPLRSAHLRDPGGPQVHFAVESFIDEVALAIGQDPLEFRLQYVKDPRDVAVIKAATEKAGWQKRTAARKRAEGDVFIGQGMSYAVRAGTRVAMVADVEVHKVTGRVRVRKFTIAHDCGLIVNPDLIRSTIEANIVQSASRALFEEVAFDEKNVTSLDWNGYRIADIKDHPLEIDVVLIDRPDVAPTGAGEASSRPTAAALANAIFDATGLRLRRAPLTPERIKAGMA